MLKTDNVDLDIYVLLDGNNVVVFLFLPEVFQLQVFSSITVAVK